MFRETTLIWNDYAVLTSKAHSKHWMSFYYNYICFENNFM